MTLLAALFWASFVVSDEAGQTLAECDGMYYLIMPRVLVCAVSDEVFSDGFE